MAGLVIAGTGITLVDPAGANVSLGVGTTPITGGTTQFLLFNNAGILGNVSAGTLSVPLVVNTTPISGGTTTKVLFDSAGILGEYTISGSGNVVMSVGAALTSATSVNEVLTTPSLTSATSVNEALTTPSLTSATVASTGLKYTGTTWANKPVAGNTGTVIFVNNVGTKGSFWYDDGTRHKALNNAAILATLDAAASMTGSVATNVFQYALTATVWQPNDRIRITGSMSKVVTTDTGVIVARVGSTGTGADAALLSTTELAAGNLQAGFLLDIVLRTTTTVQLLPNVSVPLGYTGGSSAALPAPVTIPNVNTAPTFLTFYLNAGVSAVVTMLDLQLEYRSSAN